MTETTYEQVPLGLPSPRLADTAHEPPVTPVTPSTPSFEKEQLQKRGTEGYKPTKEELEEDPLERLQRSDSDLKQRIRRLKVISRLIAACLSLAVLVPLALTLNKFLSTRDQYKIVTNESTGGAPVRRSAWALDSSTWPTYMYFSIAVISLFFNAGIMISYLHSVKTANRIASISSIFSSAVLILNLVIWAVTTSLYKHQAVITKDGKHNDLWGWTCSPAAKLIQPVFHEQLDFDQYCNIQTASWIIGLVQVGAMLLTLVLYLMAIKRLKSKKAVRKSMSARQMTA